MYVFLWYITFVICNHISIPSVKGSLSISLSLSLCASLLLFLDSTSILSIQTLLKCIVYLQTVLNSGPGVFLNIQRNYKEQAWLHFHNWASLPSTTAWLAPSREEIDNSVKAARLNFGKLGRHSPFQVLKLFFMLKTYYLLRFKGLSGFER